MAPALTISTVLGAFLMHGVAWIFQVFYYSLLGADYVCDGLFCGTPIDGVMEILATRPELSLSYAFNGIKNLFFTLLNAFAFNYDILQGGHGYVHDLIPFTIRLAGAIITTMAVAFAILQIIQSRRGLI